MGSGIDLKISQHEIRGHGEKLHKVTRKNSDRNNIKALQSMTNYIGERDRSQPFVSDKMSKNSSLKGS